MKKVVWILGILFVFLFIVPFIYKGVTGEYPVGFPLREERVDLKEGLSDGKGTVLDTERREKEDDVEIELDEEKDEFVGELPEHCSDGLFNEGEEGLDCGWSCPNRCDFVEKCGSVRRDEVWSGNVFVSCYLMVEEGVELVVEPGAVVKFKHDRDYKRFSKAGMGVLGTIIVRGTPEEQVWFTSDASDPLNGDWHEIGIGSCTDCVIDHAIVEFAELGVSQMDSEVAVTNSIIRWSNSEGLYAERSSPHYENNTLYGNGYHEIALEQYNRGVQILNNVFRDGHYALHHEKTQSHIEGNYFTGYEHEVISAGMESDIVVKGNRFEDVGENPLNVYDGSTADVDGNDYGEGVVDIPVFGYGDVRNFELDYIPGEEGDRYPYVFDAEDETRKVVKKIGKGLSFGWALTFADGFLWRFSLGDGVVGSSLDFIRVDPVSGEAVLFGNDEIMNPRGLTWDGEFFWVNDFSLLRVFKFRVVGEEIEIVDSFDIPEKEEGGLQGLTTDGEFLYLPSRDTQRLLKVDKEGVLVDSVEFGERGLGDSLVWTGEHFWSNGGCSKGLCRWSKDGKLVGEIYPVAKEAWAMDWDGEYLWTIQRTSELWDDPKIYQIDVLDDSLKGWWGQYSK